MKGARPTHPRPSARASRRQATSWPALLLLAPLLLLSIFGGRTLHAHSHGDHGMHVHIVHSESLRARPAPVALPHTHHGCDDHHHPHAPHDHTPSEPVPGHPAQDDDDPCLSLSIPERDMLPVRGVQLAVNADSAPAPVFWTSPRFVLTDLMIGSARAIPPRPPDPHPLRAGDRLVRTSLALLI